MPEKRARPQEDFYLWGVSHRTAHLSVRELWALNREEKARVCEHIVRELGGQAVVVATCNRTEFYFFRHHIPSLSALAACVARVKGRSADAASEAFYRREGAACVEHLFTVASGLDSQILGETEIQGQLKQDFLAAKDQGVCGNELGRLFEHALKVGKRVRTETGISEGVLSAGQAGVLLAKKVLGDLSHKHVLLIGSGEIGRLTARALLGEGAASLRVTSRTEENAQLLASEFGAEVVPFSRLYEAVGESDVVISSTAAPVAFVRAPPLAAIMRRRASRPLVVIDLAVPRDFEREVGDLTSVFLHDLDDLGAVVAQSRAERQEKVPQCRAIVQDEARRFLVRHLYRTCVGPAVGALFEAVEAWRREEVRERARTLPPEALPVLDEVSKHLVRGLVLKQIQRLKELRDAGNLTPEAMAVISALLEVDLNEEAARRNSGQ